jgi:hypothetical protein
MTFFRRLRLYLLGVAIGVVVVYFMLLYKRERPSWMPQGRVLEQIAASEIIFTQKALLNIRSLNLNEEKIKSSIIENGTVIFSKSDTQRKPCPVYYIENKKNNEIFVRAEVCDSICTIMWVSKVK